MNQKSTAPVDSSSEATPAVAGAADWIEVVRRHVAGLQFGIVQITVHQGRVVQVERTERFRFEGPLNPNSGSPS